MPVRAFLREKSFDPETIDLMNTAFRSVCSDLGISDPTDSRREVVARRVIELIDGIRDAEELRKAVLASMTAKA